MAKFLGDLRAVALTSLGVGLAFLLVFLLVAEGLTITDVYVPEALLRWTHVLSGIMWIGHLYYFNFTQIPNASRIPEEHRGPAIGKVIAPAALFWFRWGAVATLVTGLALAGHNGYLQAALSLGASERFYSPKHIAIGIGMWLAIVMFLNVWLVIWPAQRRALNINDRFPDLSADKRAAQAKRAMLFSRVNTLLSAPMLVAMTIAQGVG